AVITIFLGNCIVLVPMIANAHAGTRYGIPFPVYCRAAFGIRGANIPAVMRALVACGWFGLQSWIGGMALHPPLRPMGAAWGNVGDDRRSGDYRCATRLLLSFLAVEHRRRVVRHRVDPRVTQHQSTAADRTGFVVASLGLREGRWIRTDAFAAVAIRR